MGPRAREEVRGRSSLHFEIVSWPDHHNRQFRVFLVPHSDSGSRFQADPCIFLEPMWAHPVKTGLNDTSVLCSRCKQRHWERAITGRYRCWHCPHCA